MIVNQNLTSLASGIGNISRAGIEAPDPVLTHDNPHYHGFCWSCCHPAHSCCCHVPTCRKEAKELLVVPETKVAGKETDLQLIESTDTGRILDLVKMAAAGQPQSTTKARAAASKVPSRQPVEIIGTGHGTAIIGGCCCVHLSIEYMPQLQVAGASVKTPTVLVSVTDSEATTLSWRKAVHAGSVYQIRQNIIATRPGAQLDVATINVTARVRWCEIFSC